jgi:hypothetical protein
MAQLQVQNAIDKTSTTSPRLYGIVDIHLRFQLGTPELRNQAAWLES